MLSRRVQQAVMVAVASSSLPVAGVWAQTQTTLDPAQSKAHSQKVDPQINAQFQKGSVKDFIKRFESNDREVFVKRREIADVLDLKPGMAVADIGAGTGLFTRLFADAVGPGGKVYAVDVSKDFLDHIAAGARMRGQPQVETIRGTQESTAHLSADSVEGRHVSVALRNLCQPSTKAWVSASRQDKPVSSRSLARWPHSSRHSTGQPATTLR